MSTRTIRTAIFGTGFMGRVHLEALRRVAQVEIAAIAGRTAESAKRLVAGYAVENTQADYRAVLASPAIDAVHICTPNAMHFTMARDALLAGKHVLCEKPLATSVEQAQELVTLARERGLRNCVCHNLRFYPMVQQMRSMRQGGDLGEVLAVTGSYAQDWLLYASDWNWRVDAQAGGALRTMGDIGSHWFDLAEHLTGLSVTALCADLQTFHRKRERPAQTSETFAAGAGTSAAATQEVDVNTEDYGAVLFGMGERARGSMTASQAFSGRKNRLLIEIYGTKASVAWSQERPDELWVGHRDRPNEILIKDPSLLKPEARAYADLPGGHSEGYDDTFKQVFRRFYASIADAKIPAEYPQFTDGLRQITLMRAQLESHRKRAWVDLIGSAPGRKDP